MVALGQNPETAETLARHVTRLRSVVELTPDSIEILGIGIELSWLLQRLVAVGAVVVGGLLVYLLGRSLLRRSASPKYVFPQEVAERARRARSRVLAGWGLLVVAAAATALLLLVPAAVPVGILTGALLVVLVALALQGLLRDLIAGASLQLEGQLAVGDRVRLLGPDVEGVVEGIGWRVTVLQEDGARAFVANGSITGVRVLAGAVAPAVRDEEDRGRSSRRRDRTRSQQRGPRQGGERRGAGSGAREGRSGEEEGAPDSDAAQPDTARAGGRADTGGSGGSGGAGEASSGTGGRSGGRGRRRGGRSSGSGSRAARSTEGSQPARTPEESPGQGDGSDTQSSDAPEPTRGAPGESEGRAQRERGSGSRNRAAPGDEELPESPWSIE